MKFDFGIAGPGDDPAIRRLLAENPMPGTVKVAFEREPNYFLGHGVMGDRCITLKATERNTGKLAGIICLAATDRYVGGEVKPVGYIGQARIDHRFQGIMLPLRASAFIREQAKESWPNLWFGAIVDENPTARALFIDRRRKSFPLLEMVSPIQTLAFLPKSRFAKSPDDRSGSISIVRGNQAGWDSIVEFLNSQGSGREFFPHLKVEHFSDGLRTPGLESRDFLVTLIDGEIAGVCGIWDQSGFKQTVVHEYGGWLGRVRPVVNAAGPLIGMKRFPDVGGPITSAYLSFLAVRDDNPAVFRRLLSAAIGDVYSRNKNYLMAGFSIRDPLLAVARGYRHIVYRSTMYAFRFNGAIPDDAFDRAKVPYLEGATL